ncbi:MAG: hypothetical protein IPJ88_01755 [Myxococcales bacterium]|nr:MAG: hypothetical protein IPJ88_01755 [Myxococcales bacterium]
MQAFKWPVLFGVFVALVHIFFGKAFGLPPVVTSEEIYETSTGRLFAAVYSAAPLISFSFCGFVTATIVQEFWRGIKMRRKNAQEGFFKALVTLVAKARRRYGGYIVHVGIVLMCIGFTGAAYDIKKEATLHIGESLEIHNYRFEYIRARSITDPNKRMVFTEFDVYHNGKKVDQVSPAKFIYTTHPEMPTTEVAIRSRLSNDLYVIMNSVNPETKIGTFQVIYRPLVIWIWIGALILLLGVIIAMAPRISELLSMDPPSSKASVVDAEQAKEGV